MVNYVLPLVTVPYVVRIIGIENFGLLSFGVAVAGYCILICDYGFNLSATKAISLNRADQGQLRKIYSNTLTVKFLLCCFCFSVVLLICEFNAFFAEKKLLLLCSFSLVIAQASSTVWFFQGIENMGFITRVNILAKLLFTMLIFLFVKTEDDFLLVPILTGLGYMVGSIYLIIYAKMHYRMTYTLPKISELTSTLRSSFPLFCSSLSTSLYTLSAPIILTFTASAASVGAFSSAEKIVQALKGLFLPLTQAFFPYMSKLLSSDTEAGMMVLRRVLVPCIWIGLSMSAFIFYNAEAFIVLLFGTDFLEAVAYLKIMALIPSLVLISNIVGTQIILNLGYEREFTAIIAGIGIISIVIASLVAQKFGAIGIAWSLMCTELAVVISFSVFLYAKWNIIHSK